MTTRWRRHDDDMVATWRRYVGLLARSCHTAGKAEYDRLSFPLLERCWTKKARWRLELALRPVCGPYVSEAVTYWRWWRWCSHVVATSSRCLCHVVIARSVIVALVVVTRFTVATVAVVIVSWLNRSKGSRPRKTMMVKVSQSVSQACTPCGKGLGR